MHSSEDMTTQILAALAAMPLEARTSAILGAIGAALKEMSVFRILEIRQNITRELETEIPLVQAALDVIDGQLALREIAGSADWR